MEITTLNKANFGNCEFGVSPLKTSSSGKSKFYWVLIYPPKGGVVYCATSESLTKIMGEDCDDKKFCEEILPKIAGQFEVAPIIDDTEGTEATFDDGTVIHCIRKKAHRMQANW